MRQSRLKMVLFERGVSQRQLAAGIGRHASFVSRLVQGKIPVRAGIRRRIAAFLGLGQRELFPYDPQQRRPRATQGTATGNGSSTRPPRASGKRQPAVL